MILSALCSVSIVVFTSVVQSQNPVNAVYSSCTGKGITTWNRNKRTIPLELESWLESCISVPLDSENKENEVNDMFDGVQSVVIDPSENIVEDHWRGVNDYPTEDYVLDNDRKVKFIRFKNNILIKIS